MKMNVFIAILIVILIVGGYYGIMFTGTWMKKGISYKMFYKSNVEKTIDEMVDSDFIIKRLKDAGYKISK